MNASPPRPRPRTPTPASASSTSSAPYATPSPCWSRPSRTSNPSPSPTSAANSKTSLLHQAHRRPDRPESVLHGLCGNSITAAEALVAATELRQSVAHGVSRGFSERPSQAPAGRQEAWPAENRSCPFSRRSAALLLRLRNPQLAPWAAFCRNSVASPKSAQRRWMSTPLIKPELRSRTAVEGEERGFQAAATWVCQRPAPRSGRVRCPPGASTSQFGLRPLHPNLEPRSLNPRPSRKGREGRKGTGRCVPVSKCQTESESSPRTVRLLLPLCALCVLCVRSLLLGFS